ncbi:MAG: Na+/H+ antiporter NhaC family protein [Myxococcota bacterium]
MSQHPIQVEQGRPFRGLALLVLCALGLLRPDVPDASRWSQSLADWLRLDAARAREGAPSVLGALAERVPNGTVSVEVRVDGAAREDERLLRALRSGLNAFRERPPTGLSPPLPTGQDLPRFVVTVVPAGAELAVEAFLETPDARERLGPSEVRRLPSRWALLPPLVAVALALWWRRTLPALLGGVWCGSLVRAAGEGQGAWSLWSGTLDVVRRDLWRELTSSFRFEILAFVVVLLAMVGIMTRAGGVAGLVERALRFARDARSGQLTTFGSGLVLFFDDYANCMLVGNSLRPLTDRLRISREKLAYLVDSTAAPVAGVALLSTWIAFQVSVYAPQLPAVGIDADGYAVFVASLPYRYYCWLTLAFVFLIAWSGRDFGPMRRAEVRARTTGALWAPGAQPGMVASLSALEPKPGLGPAAHRAVWPLLATLFATVAAIAIAGGAVALLGEGAWRDLTRWRAVLFAGSGAAATFHGALVGLAVAMFLAGSRPLRWGLVSGAGLAGVLYALFGIGGWGAVAGGVLGSVAVTARMTALGEPDPRPHLTVPEMARAAAGAGPTVGFAVGLLFLAWMIGAVCGDLGTGPYLAALLSDALPAAWLPAMLFVASALVAFATGSSWSTMSILLPNAIPLAASLGAADGSGLFLVVWAVAAVLDGAIFGDHCSPISDTTVLSALATGCDHLDHVRTQAPYALCVAGTVLALGYAPLWAGVSLAPGWVLVGGLVGLALLVRGFGRASPAPS